MHLKIFGILRQESGNLSNNLFSTQLKRENILQNEIACFFPLRFLF